MKKLLGLLAAVGITATSATSVIACDTAGLTDPNYLGEIDNIFPETIIGAYAKNHKDVDASQLELFSYDQTSAVLVYKKEFKNNTKFEPINVNYTIKALDLSEDNQSLVTNIIAGSMDENGVIDQSRDLATVIKEEALTKNSIYTSFAMMNGIYLNENDFELGEINYKDSSTTVQLISKNQSILKGEGVVLTINSDVNSADLLRNTDIGNIYLPEALFAKKEELWASVFFTLPVLFQNLGDRNQLFNYLVRDLVYSSMYIMMYVMPHPETMSIDNFYINLAWGDGNQMTSILDSQSQTVNCKFNIVKDERPILGDFISEVGLEVSKEIYETNSASKVKQEIYNQTSDEFKKLVSVELFERFTKVHFVDGNPTIEVLPGSDYIYGVDLTAFELISSDDSMSQEDKDKLTPPSVNGTPGYAFTVVG